MNILFISRRFPPSVGGMQRYAYDLHQAISEQTNVKLIKWGGSNAYLPVVLPYFFIRASWLLATRKIDIIHMQDGLPSPMAVVLKWIFRKPLCVVVHGLDVTYENNLYQAVIPRALKRADHIFCVSSATRDEVTARGIDLEKTSVVPLGITDDLFINDKSQAKKYVLEKLGVTDQKTQIILSTGRLVKRKGMEWFIENVMPQIHKAHPNALLLVSGEGPYRPEIEAAIKKHGLEQSVYLLGRVSDEYLKQLYNSADVFVMPNIRVPGDMEGFGRVLLEAALCEVPVVAAGIEGITDAIIDQKNGVLVESANANAFTAQVKSFLSDPAKSQGFGKKARTYTLDNYNWPAIANKFIATYSKLLK